MFPLLTRADMIFSGRWQTGGRVLVRDGDLSGSLDLSPTHFALAAILVRSAKSSPRRLANGSALSFLSSRDLAQELKRRMRLHAPPRPSRIARYVYDLRRALAGLRGGKPAARRWARQLLESQGRNGYRWSTYPANLQLDVDDDPDPSAVM